MMLIKRLKPANFAVSLAMVLSLMLALLASPLQADAAKPVVNPPVAVANPYPNSMAATGDSITRAFNTSPYFPFIDATANSWSTGTTRSVSSHYSRILAKNATISGKNYNDAKTGTKMADLKGQMTTAVNQGVEYVTVLMGANDVCADSEANMTSVDMFTQQFTDAMNTITANNRKVRVFVSSIPNIYNLWSILHKNPYALTAWSAYGICQSMLVNASNDDPNGADELRRKSVQARNVAFNKQLEAVCLSAIYNSRCQFDAFASYNTNFVDADVSTRDYFHPSLTGQATIANISWGATYKFGT